MSRKSWANGGIMVWNIDRFFVDFLQAPLQPEL